MHMLYSFASFLSVLSQHLLQCYSVSIYYVYLCLTQDSNLLPPPSPPTTTGIVDNLPSKKNYTVRYLVSEHEPIKVDTKENVAVWLFGRCKYTKWIPDAAFHCTTRLALLIPLTLCFLAGLTLGTLILAGIVSSEWNWLTYVLMWPPLFTSYLLLNVKIAWKLSTSFQPVYQIVNILLFSAALYDGVGEGRRDAMVALIPPLLVVVYLDAFPGITRRNAVNIFLPFYFLCMASMVALSLGFIGSFTSTTIFQFDSAKATTAAIAKAVGINILTLVGKSLWSAFRHPRALLLLGARIDSRRLGAAEEQSILQRKEDKAMFKGLPTMGQEFLDAMLGSKGAIPWEVQTIHEEDGGGYQLLTRPYEGKASSSLIQMKICFNVATDVRSAFEGVWNLGDNFTGHILDEANFDQDAEERFLCNFYPSPVIGVSDRVFAWKNWGKVLNDDVAFNVALTTPKALQLLDESGLLQGKTVVVGDLHVGGYAFEHINNHACQVTYLTCIDTKGNLPHWIVNKAAANSAIRTFTKYTKQFGSYIDEGSLLSSQRSNRSWHSKKRMHKHAVTPVLDV